MINVWDTERRIADKLAKLNAAIASLMQATAGTNANFLNTSDVSKYLLP